MRFGLPGVTIACVVAIGVLVMGAAGAAKESDDPLALVRKGLSVYAEKGPREALDAMLVGSPIEGSKEALSQANVLLQIAEFYGPYRGYSIARVVKVSDSTRFAYLVLNFERGPLFGCFVLYERPGFGWVLPQFKFHTEAQQVWPATLLTDSSASVE